ncbi:RTP4 isoform 1 [Pan troglodytes]|uniref:RTP4 isoform 1 n=1 Tax=Pan troglodytes TaxID=9598 RepID=A0A2J8M629_PANTR|nr:RTP4 isoform 1 [Pan troglodytes]
MVVDFWTWEQTFQELIQEAKPQATWTLKLDGNPARLPGSRVEAIPTESIWLVPVFLLPAKLGFRPSADSVPHVLGALDIPGPGAYEALWPKVPEVLLVPI